MTTTTLNLSPEIPDQKGLMETFRVMGLLGPVMIGLGIIVLFFGGFLGWAALAPIGSAAIAPGVVSVETNRKTIQHLEGGIVGEIRVRDGDVVKAGDALIVLDDTKPRAALELVRGRLIAAMALRTRLTAERDDRDKIDFPKSLLDQRGNPKVAEALSGQTSIFQERRRALAGQTKILNQQVAQLNEEIKGLIGQIKSEDRQMTLISDEINDISNLVKEGVVPRPRLRRLQRNAAEIEGNLSRNKASIAEASQAIAGTKLRISELRTARANEVVQELRDVESEMFDLVERERTAEDVLSRTIIRAPLGGTVVNLHVHTPGGVIAPGAALLDIVPSEDRLVIEARVSPQDVDVVHIGLKAQARITAFSQRSTQPVDGTVIQLSADSLSDERTGETYYLARIKIKDDLQEKLGGAKLHPGMQAEVMIVTGERTALEYFFNPLTNSFNRALREN